MVDYLALFIFILPSYIANSIPVLLGGGAPMDFGYNASDKRRLLGPSKTWRGFFAGVGAGTLVGGILALSYPLPFFATPHLQFFASFTLALGTMIGDAFGSFIKRRTNIAPGKPFLLDSILFLIIALLFALPYTAISVYSFDSLAFLIILTLILHPLSNLIANKLGWKRVPW